MVKNNGIIDTLIMSDREFTDYMMNHWSLAKKSRKEKTRVIQIKNDNRHLVNEINEKFDNLGKTCPKLKKWTKMTWDEWHSSPSYHENNVIKDGIDWGVYSNADNDIPYKNLNTWNIKFMGKKQVQIIGENMNYDQFMVKIHELENNCEFTTVKKYKNQMIM